VTRRGAIPALAPFLAAWYLGLMLLGEGGITVARWPDVWGTLLLATLTAVIAWWIAHGVRPERNVASVFSVMLVAWFGLFGTLRLLLGPNLPESWSSPGRLLLMWLLPAIVMGLGVRHVRPLGDGVVRGLTASLALLALLACFGLLRHQEARTPVLRAAGADTRTATRPDIYLIVLDKFSSPATMRDVYGVDLTRFVDSLTALGFVVPARARTNYIHSELAIATLLDGRLIHETLDSVTASPLKVIRQRANEAYAWTVARRQGYRTVFFSTGFPGTLDAHGADIALAAPVRPESRLGGTWLLNTPLETLRQLLCRGGSCQRSVVFPYPPQDAETLRWQLRTLAALPDEAGPVLAVLHFLGSHEPYLFEADCSPREAWWPAREPDADSLAARAAYGAQIRCVSSMVLATVTDLIARSEVPPVILLQADHGNGEIAVDFVRGITRPIEAMAPERIRERLDVFAAYRFPGAIEVVPDSITPVNVLPIVFRQLFGESTAYRPDRSFWSTYQRPLDVTEVTRAAGTAGGSATIPVAPAQSR